MINLLIAIDGTESKGYSRRWIEEFYNSFEVSSENGDSGINKYYNCGPHTTSFGEHNSREIYLDCIMWLAKAIVLHYSHSIKKKLDKNLSIVNQHQEAIDKVNVWSGTPTLEKTVLSLETLFDKFDNKEAIKHFVKKSIRISIVGHSRGGHVAIALNNFLNSIPFKIHFLGLLDPVDLDGTLKIETKTIQANFKNIFHAVRSKEFAEIATGVRSTIIKNATITTRKWFGYDGNSNVNHDVEEYLTSHGGIGGSPLDFVEHLGYNFPIWMYNDITGNINYNHKDNDAEKMILRLNKLNSKHESEHKGTTGHYNKPFPNFNMHNRLNFECVAESKRVRRDFFQKAKKSDLVIRDITGNQ